MTLTFIQAVFGSCVMLVAEAAVAAEKMSWEGGVTAVFQATNDEHADDELSASADLFWRLPRTSGDWLLYLEAATSVDSDGIAALYPTANGDAGTVLGRSGNGGVQISELNYTFRLSANRTLMLGLIDPSAWLDRSRRTNDENQHFLNDSFVNNRTIEFPDYGIGGVARWPGSESRPEFTVVISGSHGLADTAERSYGDLVDLTESGRGMFVGAGASWLRSNGTFRFGGWLRTDGHAVAGAEFATDDNYGLYAVYDWQKAGHAMNARAGIANGRVSEAEYFLALAYERQYRHGVFGIGIARTYLSSDFHRPDGSDSTDVEIFYRIEIGKQFGHVTPSIQYIANPQFVESGQSDALMFGIRVRWRFR